MSESNAVFTLLAWIGHGSRRRRRPTAAEAGTALGFLGERAGKALQLTQDREAIRAAVERFALEVGESADLPEFDGDGAVAFFDATRAAETCECCTCGRPALVVFSTGDGREVGYCGRSGAPPLVPCVFCGATTRHLGPCAAYRLDSGPVLATSGRAE